ncbi:hypothetical protein K466DRAFT_504366 [Polyporus arcularius HHB13444]|uniref:Uncharacterized protein n=1 Tax=Polyporus arcularius HHB13444 TaxID=1314778 RepID=A0A5C3P341_9APHY|nr:hypothetical protein K466DRAFT_504366 [Polyporus arcularius HHB13444]
MSSASSSSSFLGYNPADNSQDSDPARSYIGRPIISRTPTDDFSVNLPSTSRRRSIPNQAQSTSATVSRPPLLQSLRPIPRRTTHTPSSSITSSRRPSLPTILHQPSAKTLPPPPLPNDNAHLNPNDDIYSNLSTFTFGAARSNPARRTELISPFTVSNPPGADSTPRQSVSTSSSRTRTPRIQTKDFEEGERADDQDEEEAARQNRAKMRAIDDGTRRPSLPINAHSGPSGSPSPPRHDTDSEAEPDSTTTYDDDAEDLDTDVEFDYRIASRDDVSDNASLHTFGGGPEHYAAIESAREERMSMAHSFLDEEEVGENVGAGESSPVTSTRVRDAEASQSLHSSPPQSRRGSLPWGPGAPNPNARDREDSEATILAGRRMSRNLNDELGHPTGPSPIARTTSQPTSPSDWHALEAQLQQGEQGQLRQGGAEQAAEAFVSDTYEGFNLQYILGDGLRRSWSSGAPSYIAPVSESRRQSTSIAPWEAYSISSGRRSSTTTMSDDPFTSQLRKLDKGYTRRREEWSFRKETADGPGQAAIRAGRPAVHELWRHQYVGRFKVDKQWTEHPSKAPTQRINVRHINDPFSRGNTRGGPHSIIHRHSRAVAFSIFRKYGLFGRTHKPGGTSFHVHTSGTILLATMDVQAQFTSTRTTSQLNTHNLLSDGTSRGKDREDGERSKDREKTKDEKKAKDKDRAKRQSQKATVSVTSDTSSHTASVGSVASHATSKATDEDSPMGRPPGFSPPSVPVSPTLAGSSFSAVATTSYAPSITTTALSVRESMDTRSPASSMDVTMSPADRLGPSIARLPLREDDNMDLDDEEYLIHSRTSHAEAFATLDSTSIEYLRGRSEHHVDHDHSGGGLMERLARRIRGQNIRVSSGKPAGPSPDVPFTPTLPPWVTLAPRSKQEERERVIQNLNESFKDVGLLPTFKSPHRGERSKGKQPMNNHAGVNVFEEVPPDALHMLLPLWPCNTDEASTVPGEDPNKYVIPVEERQYLIVYYVPFDERKDKNSNRKQKGDANKKRSRADSLAASAAASPKMKGIPRSAFRVCARLVSYHDFLGTGVRLPSEGLTITGSMAEAMADLPPASIREKHPGDMVIGVCSGRDRDIEFIPEGLACVGLCTAVEEQPPQPPSPVHEEEMMDEVDPVFTLTPIGRAAVEMAWLGCLAITFSDVNPPSTK